MKKVVNFYLFALIVGAMFSCKDDPTPVVADFDFTIEGDVAPAKVTIVNKSTGASTYSWTFAGGEPSVSSEQNPGVVNYKTAGTYKISLQACNGDDCQVAEKNVTIGEPIAASFTVSPTFGLAPLSVVITNTTSANATTYAWTFEGGTPATSSQKDPGTVVFSAVGSHKIKLTASNTKDSKSFETSVYVSDVVSDFNFTFQNGLDYSPATIVLENTSSANAKTFAWTFQGGTPASSNVKSPASVVLNDYGNILLSLIASDGDVQAPARDKVAKVYPGVLLGQNRSLNYWKATVPTLGGLTYKIYFSKDRNVYKAGEQSFITIEGAFFYDCKWDWDMNTEGKQTVTFYVSVDGGANFAPIIAEIKSLSSTTMALGVPTMPSALENYIKSQSNGTVLLNALKQEYTFTKQ